jgi:putative acyl-CoA dehydrogenase
MARIYREMPLNSIWEGAGNIMALDLLRALRSGPVKDAVMQETAAARRASAAVERRAAQVADALDGRADEAGARRLARDTALLLQAAMLHAHAPAEVFDSFCAARLDDASDAFGLLPGRLPLQALIQRAHPTLNT